MTWTSLYLVCFLLGFSLSAISWLLGALHLHVHLPHAFHGGTPHAHGHGVHGHAGHHGASGHGSAAAPSPSPAPPRGCRRRREPRPPPRRATS